MGRRFRLGCGERQLEADAIVTILAARWLAWCDEDERAEGLALLRAIVERWLAQARPMLEPLAELRRQRSALEQRGARVAPRARLEVLRLHARHAGG